MSLLCSEVLGRDEPGAAGVCCGEAQCEGFCAPGWIHRAGPAACPEILLFLSRSRVVRKSIARVLTVINQTQKENLRKFYKVRTNIFCKWPLCSCCSQLRSLWEGLLLRSLKLNEKLSFMFCFFKQQFKVL